MSTWEVLKAPGVGIVLFIFGHTMLLALAFTAVSPVFLFTSVERGGLSFDPTQISYYLAGAGASQALWMLLAFPPLQRRLGSGNLFRVCAVVWPLFMAAYPVANELARRDHWTALYVLLVPMLIGGSGVAMAFSKQHIASVFSLMLTGKSLLPAFHQRHLTLTDSSRHCKCTMSYRQQCGPRCSASTVHEYLCFRGEDTLGRWTSCLDTADRNCCRPEHCDTLSSRSGRGQVGYEEAVQAWFTRSRQRYRRVDGSMRSSYLALSRHLVIDSRTEWSEVPQIHNRSRAWPTAA